MRNEIKLEILKILLRRFLEISQDPLSTSDRLNQAFIDYQDTLQEQNDFISQYKILVRSQNDQLAVSKKIKNYLDSFKKSWRFRIGDSLINILGFFAGKNNDGTAFDKANEHLAGLIGKQRSLLQLSDEPPHYLNPRYWVGRRDFQDNLQGKDGSVAIIILNLNGEKYLRNLFESFIKFNTYKNFRFIIVDHGSEDQSAKIIEEFKKTLPVDLHRFDQNFTFSYSNNFAVTGTDAEYVLFLNNDMVFIDDVIGKYIEIFQQSAEIGIVGATLYFPGPSLYETGNIQHSGIIFRRELTEPQKDNSHGETDKMQAELRPMNVNSPQEGEIVEWPAVTGAAMMIRREDFIHLHGFDENYIWGYEDVDLCLSCLKNAGKKVVAARSIRIIHDESATRKSRQDFNNIVREHNLDVLNKNHGLFIRQSFMEKDQSGAKGTDHVRIAIKVPGGSGMKTEKWGDTYFAAALGRALELSGCLVRIDFQDDWYNHSYLEDNVVIVLRGLKRYYPKSGQLNLMWNISHPDLITEEEYNGFDHIFIASLATQVGTARNIRVPVTSLLQCTDPGLFYPETRQDVPANHYLFIGSSRGQFRESVRYAFNNGIRLNVYGNNWEKLLPKDRIKGEFIPNDQLRNYYSGCRILFNDHWKDMSENGFMSNRLFDAVACGCVVISDDVKGIPDIFGDCVKVYYSEQDFLSCIREVDDNFEDYKNKAMARGEIIRKEHSFKARAGVILGVMEKHLKRAVNQKTG